MQVYHSREPPKSHLKPERVDIHPDCRNNDGNRSLIYSSTNIGLIPGALISGKPLAGSWIFTGFQPLAITLPVSVAFALSFPVGTTLHPSFAVFHRCGYCRFRAYRFGTHMPTLKQKLDHVPTAPHSGHGNKLPRRSCHGIHAGRIIPDTHMVERIIEIFTILNQIGLSYLLPSSSAPWSVTPLGG